MTKFFTKSITLFLLFFVFVSFQKSYSQCFQIESILVAACSPPGPASEGYNEMVSFRVGSAPLNVNNLSVNWPSNSWQGLVQNAATAAKVATLNIAITAAGSCAELLEPPTGGIIPAGSPVILVTSYLMDTNSNSFGALAEDTYIIFQNNPSATGGHFGNYNASGGTRTLSMTFSGAGGCTDTVSYQRDDLTGSMGDTVLYTPSGTPTYVNYGCSAPIPPFTVDAGTAPTNPCPGTTIALLGTAEGETSVAWSAPSGTFSSSTTLGTNYTIPPSAAGQTITLTLIATNGCGASIPDTVTITVSNGTVPTFTLPATLCSGDTAPVLPTTSNNGITGTWSPSVVSNIADGSYVFTPTAGSCNVPYTYTVTIQTGAAPITGFNYTTPVCATSTPVTPNTDPGFVTGGTFTSNIAGLSINASTGEINVGASTPNTYIVTYTIPASGGCNPGGSSSSTIEITAAITPGTNFSYPANICISSTSVMIIPGPGFTPGGTFTSDTGLTINPATGEVNPSTSTPNPHSVIYTVPSDPANCIVGNAGNTVITFVTLITPAVAFTYPAQACETSAAVSPTTPPGTSGGTFTGTPGLVINATTGQIDVASSTVGNHTITYTVTANPAACLSGDSSSEPFEIVSSTTPSVTFSYPAQVCSASAPVLPTTAPATAGGTFTGTPGLVINATTGEVNVTASTVANHTITYTLTADPAICQAAGTFSVPFQITGSTTAITGFSYASPVCIANALVTPTTVPGFVSGGTFTATPGLSINAATGEIDPSASTAGPHTVTYTIPADPATCNAGGMSTANITINNLAPAVIGFSYTTPVCPGDGPQNANLVPNFNMGGAFTGTAGLVINPTTGQINVAASTPGAHTVTYTIAQNNSTCTDAGVFTAPFTIDNVAALTPITGGPSVCLGSTLQLANATPGGTWSSSDNAIATVDANGLVTTLAPSFVTITYTLSSGCGQETSTILAIYNVPQPLLEDRVLCINNETGLPFNSVNLTCGVPNENFSFVWTLDGNSLPTTTNTHEATETGVYQVTVTNTISGCTNVASCTVSESSSAVATATVEQDFNLNQIITVTVTEGSGDYLFQLDHGVPQESNVFTGVYQGEYTITVIDRGGCQDFELTVFALNYPRFFTPNGDGFNDTWGIRGLNDPTAKTYIFDRYGKMVKFLNADSEEWDGTLNGYQLPSTDYWFLLEYKNRDGVSKELKAHFSMKR